MACEIFYYQGIGECTAFREGLRAMVPMNKNQTITAALAATLVGWKAALVPVAGVTGSPLFIKDYEVNSAGQQEVTSSTGYTDVLPQDPPKMTAYLKMSYADYILWLPFINKEFQLPLFDESGNALMTKTGTAGTVKGFSGKVSSFAELPLPAKGDRQKEFKLMVTFTDAKEFLNIVQISTNFSIPELMAITPVGLDLSIITAYAVGGDVVLQANYRNETRPYAGLTAATNFVVKRAITDIGTTVTITSAANAALGQYTVNVVNGTPADMTGNFFLQAVDDDATYVTHLSNVLEIVV